jgi:Secretion system C-terminal sorting domain/SprB repeat
MSSKFYALLFLIAFPFLRIAAQPCDSLIVTAESFESRCASTGRIVITASNGSGTYNYSVTGPVSTPYTSSNEITGLPAGTYTVSVRDVVNDCIYTLPQPVIVMGDYDDPRFSVTKTNVTCINGTDGTITVDTVLFGRAPFSYTIVAPSTAGVGTTSASGMFTGLSAGNYFIQLRDSCGGIQTRNITILNYNWFIDPYSVTRVACDSADIFIGLKDIFGNTNTTDTVFNGFTYTIITPDGDTIASPAHSIRIRLGDLRSLRFLVTDRCGNTKAVNWIDTNIPKVANAVAITNQTCFDFSALITGQQNLTNPEYCLYDSLDNVISCNTTGEFPNLTWGSYCIKITDVCYDTVITRCFNAIKPIPSVNANVTVSYGDDCRVVTVSINGQTNLFNPTFCLYDSADVLISCNATGVFGNVPVGKYCMKITGSICNDTTLIRCFEVVPLPVGPGSGPEFSNFNCSTFTGSIVGTVGLGNATYCLYDSANQLIRCNTTGVFDSLAYGSYCITIQVSIATGGCADTLFPRCFTVIKPQPVLGPLTIQKKCSNFSIQLQSYENFFNPQFCLYQDSTLIDCNNTGIFTNLPYGEYCIRGKDSCTDSTLQRCFKVIPDILMITGSASPSCTLGYTTINGTMNNGFAPFTISLQDSTGAIISTIITNNSSFEFDALENLPLNQQYKIIVTDSCGNSAEFFTAPVISIINRSKKVTGNCPGGIYINGSSDIELTLTSNLGKMFPRIIRKNGVNTSINYTFSNTAQTIFTFKNLEPATYIIRNRINNNGCTITLFDTITVTAYAYPALQNSSLYRCDDNSFSINAVTAGGISPYLYEITGSMPALPSIVSAVPQTSPSFIINNGTAYSLVRLRVLDACGNASINDISTVPLINVVVNTDGGCLNGSATLRVDSVAGASYSWYKRVLPNDSVLIGNRPSYYLPAVTLADTGLYFCKVVLNSGCITRIARYYVDGLCGVLSPGSNILLSVKRNDKQALLNWSVNNEQGIKRFEIEVKRSTLGTYRLIDFKQATNATGYMVTDTKPETGVNFYRIKAVYESGKISYSNIVTLNFKESGSSFTVYPNPATDVLNIKWHSTANSSFSIQLFDLTNKLILETTMQAERQLQLRKPMHLQRGMYLLHLTDIKTHEKHVLKVIFQ